MCAKKYNLYEIHQGQILYQIRDNIFTNSSSNDRKAFQLTKTITCTDDDFIAYKLNLYFIHFFKNGNYLIELDSNEDDYERDNDIEAIKMELDSNPCCSIL